MNIALKGQQRMSELLYDYMMKEYENMGREERILLHKTNCCSCCRFCDYCNTDNLPEDIMKPIPSDKAWIPARKSCEKFQWS